MMITLQWNLLLKYYDNSFHKEFKAAEAIMLKIHIDGEAVCGSYSYDVAQSKVTQVIDYSRQNEQPLMCVLRELIN